MRIGSVIIDTDNMRVEEVDVLIKELKQIRERKGTARGYKHRLGAMLESMSDDDFVFCNRHTGEVLIANDWVVFDQINQCTHGTEIDP